MDSVRRIWPDSRADNGPPRNAVQVDFGFAEDFPAPLGTDFQLNHTANPKNCPPKTRVSSVQLSGVESRPSAR